MSVFRSKLPRFHTECCQQIMPVPVVSIYGLSLDAPKPLYNCPIPMTLKRDEVAKPAVVPMEIGQYPTHKVILPGEIVANNTGIVPPEFLACNGKEVSRTTYSMLFNIIGTYYGDGNNTTTFHLPNLSNVDYPHVIYMIKYDLS